MRSKAAVVALASGFSLAWVAMTLPGAAQQPPRSDAGAAIAAPVYRPPARGAPGGRVGGGTRGHDANRLLVAALVPDHSAQTAQEQPTLYWFISAGTSLPVEFTLVDPRSIRPAVEARLPGPIPPGIHRIRLAEHGIRLEPGIAYRWFVSVVADPARRSRDIVAGGVVERVHEAPSLQSRLSAARPEELPAVYAEHGLWYDALDALSALIDRAPNDQTLHQHRAALISQADVSLTGTR